MATQTKPTEVELELQGPAQPETAPADGDTTAAAEDTTVVLDDLLVEDVSIDGMCGVY